MLGQGDEPHSAVAAIRSSNAGGSRLANSANTERAFMQPSRDKIAKLLRWPPAIIPANDYIIANNLKFTLDREPDNAERQGFPCQVEAQDRPMRW